MPKAIVKHYLGCEFGFDFISTVPLKAIGVNLFGITNQTFIDLADMCTLLKAFRIKKIEKKIRMSNITSQAKAQAILGFWLFVIVIYTHIFACLLWWILQNQQLWVPPLDAGFFSLRIYMKDEVSLETDP